MAQKKSSRPRKKTQRAQEKSTCLIPFYNEDERIFKTVELISSIQEIDEIICVDDGSTDSNHTRLKKLFPKIHVLRLRKNQGKSSAVLHGLMSVTTPRVLLLDADLQQLQKDEIITAITAVKSNSKIDMLILRRSNYAPLVTAIRHDILMSGERIMRTEDLKEVFKKPPTGYQLEVAINDYMMKKEKKCYWIQTSLANSYKMEKWTLSDAVLKYRDEWTGYISYDGPITYLSQIFAFCKDEYPH